jgi:uncharacterized peroxidase-related enzyme
MFVETIAPEDATGEIAALYRADIEDMGFVMSATECWTARPDFLPVWHAFFEKVKAGFSLPMRDWRLITFIAAKQVPSSYCSVVYGRLLVDDLGSTRMVKAVQADFRNAGLSGRDVAMLDYAEKIALNAYRIAETDIAELRTVGFSDVEIADIALCASLRCFMARFFDAVGAGPEAAFVAPDPAFGHAMAVGRPLARTDPSA